MLHPYSDTVYAKEGDRRTSWSGRLIDGGDYRVRASLGREAARHAKGATFTLGIEPT